MIALDLFVGLMTSGLPDNDSVLLTWVLLQSYGPHKRKDIHLDFAEIEEYTGMHRNNARASAKNLAATGYLRRNDDGSYRFLKDWESFRPKRGAFVDRLNGGLKRFAKAALTHDKFIKKCKPEAIQPNCPDSSKVNSVELPCTSVGNSDELGSCSEGQFSRIGTDAYATPGNGDATTNDTNGLRQPLASERVRASEELEIREKRTKTHRENSGVCVSINGAEPIPIEDVPLQADPALDPTELARVQDKAEFLFPGLYFGSKVRGLAGTYSLATIEAALGETHASDVWTWKYLLGIAKRIDAQGGPRMTSGGPPAPKAAEPVETPEQKDARLASATERMKAYRAQLAQEGRSASR